MKLPKLLLATTALVAMVGATSAVASSLKPAEHEMTVSLPNGASAHILYAGNVPPKVTVSDRPEAIGWEPDFFGPDSAFAELDRISAQMDRAWENFDRRMAQFVASPNFGSGDNLATLAANGKLPSGVTGYSFVSTITSNGPCTKFVKVTSETNAKPQVVSQVSGNCGGDSKSSTNSALQIKDHASHNLADRRQI